MPFQIANRVALVTGGNRGIGREIVQTLLQRGAKKVYVAVRRPETAADLVEREPDRVVVLQVDLCQPSSIAAAAEAASDVELVINNAGVLKNSDPFDPQAIENLGYEIDINVFGLMRMAQAFAPILKANGGGALVQLNSVASLRSFADFCTYAASKAAAYSITQALRDKLAAQGTLVVSVHPGPIATEMAQNAGLGDFAEPPALVAEAIMEGLANDQFHVFPDSMAKQFWSAYEGFAREMVETPVDE